MNKLWAVAILALPLAARAQENSGGAEAAGAPVTAAAAAAPAAEQKTKTVAEQRADLRKMAEVIATDFTDEQWAESVRKGGVTNLPESRRDALRGIYARLAQLDYEESLKDGADETQVKAGLSTVEAGDVITVQPIGAPRLPAGPGAVRGGRTVASDDPELAGVDEELTKVGRELEDAALPQDKRAQLLLQRGRLYGKLAQAQRDERSRWLTIAQLIGERFTDESWRAAVEANPQVKAKFPASRTEALRLCYAKLAELDYRDSLKAGPAVEQKPQVQAALETVNAGAPVETGWRDWVNTLNQGTHQGPIVYRPTAVAAVRGGRSITASDPEAQDIAAEMEQVDGKLQAAAPLTPETRADLLYRRGRLFDRMAARTQTAAPSVQLSPKEIYEKCSPAVVVVVAMGKDGVGELGTGSIIDKDGRVLTNAHVVTRDRDRRPYETVKIYLKPAEITGDNKKDLRNPVAMRVARFDRALDLAVLEPARSYAAPATLAFGSSAGVEPGEPVVAIGHPEQGGLWTLTTGVISTTLADLGGVRGKDVFQTDASINRGNSGGPLLNRGGALIGVNTSMARKAADGLTITSVNFSIKSAVAQRWLASSGETATAAPVETAPAAEAVPVAAEPVAKAEAPKPEAAKPAPQPKPAIVTPAKPYRVESVLEDEMKEMEDLETEMRSDIERRRGGQ